LRINAAHYGSDFSLPAPMHAGILGAMSAKPRSALEPSETTTRGVASPLAARLHAQSGGCLPRLLRLRDAPRYLGMDRNKFNAMVRPHVTGVPLGKQALAFDRLELDAWAEEYIARNGRPGRSEGVSTWDARSHRASSNAAASGTSTNASAGGEFARALEALNSGKPRTSSPG
jgi:hypothetical protein